ncbi:2-hydroxyacid dehydrogenase [Candidatus Bathyarchaeota archaeon]|nr:2-hydroxyacid dehydrogenase [Candidatus Bathyarchaeota archaeon]
MADIIVLYDRWMKLEAEEMWRTAFSEALGDDFGGHGVRFVENVEGDFKWSTEVKNSVKEANGDSSNILKNMRGAEVAVSGYAPFTGEIMDASPGLKVIGISRGGPVNVDQAAATERGVLVLRAVGRNAESVADQTLGFILSESRNIARHHHALRSGEYFKRIEGSGRQDYMDGFRWMELSGKTLGLIGYGQVGYRVAKRAKAFDMKVKVYDPYVDEKSLMKDGCIKTGLDELLATSDFVSVHAKLTPDTRHMLNEKTLRKMKPTAVLVNTARGGIIDEEALCTALRKGWIGGAALDVYEDDPIKPGNRLLELDNVTLTPHSAGRSPETEMRGYRQIAVQVASYLRGEGVDPVHVTNKAVLG